MEQISQHVKIEWYFAQAKAIEKSALTVVHCGEKEAWEKVVDVDLTSCSCFSVLSKSDEKLLGK